MKKFVLLCMATALLTIFNGCQKEELNVRKLTDEVQPQAVVQPDVYVEGDYLVFKDFEVYSTISDKLESMSDFQIDNWENDIGFFSARSLLNEVYIKLEREVSLENYEKVKKEYKGRIMFTADRDIVLPFYATAWENVLNPKGEMKIGNTLYKFFMDKEVMIMDGTLNDLKNLSEIVSDTTKVKIFYPNGENLLKSVQWGTLLSGTEWNGSKMRLDWNYQLISLYYTGYGIGSTYYTEKGFELKHWMRQKRKKLWWSYNKTQYYMISMNLHIEFYRDYSALLGWSNKFVYNQSIPDYTSPETTNGCTYQFLRYYDVVSGYSPQVTPEIYNNSYTFWSRGLDYANRKTINYTNQ